MAIATVLDPVSDDGYYSNDYLMDGSRLGASVEFLSSFFFVHALAWH